ncbi:hypothetical protein BCR44DRAFT_1435687 [Catenaria anguillulae PL171]|uniref:Uncharacterized protein n=1 Tax=Catenaria anguillulae PL171 TaxID=765915 RepID=A0A1Y2HJD7_9FUNG|nr:hypothetical protein BCR44DRAFT_1435687 [Catenaria anguillulae PL171]
MHSMNPPLSSSPALTSSASPPPLPSSDLPPDPLQNLDSPSVEASSAMLQYLSLPSAASPTHDATTLTDELLVLILVHATRQTVGRHQQLRLAQLINVASVERFTDVARAALTQAWWMSLDAASRAGSLTWLDLLIELHLQRLRPLKYSRGGLLQAVEKADVHVIEWWYFKRQEGRLNFADLTLSEILGCLNPQADKEKAFPVLRWFFKNHFGLDVVSSEADALDEERKMELVGRVEAKTFLFSAAKFGFKQCLAQVALKLCARGAHSHLDLEAWTDVVSGGHAECAEILARVALLDSYQLASKQSAMEMIQAAFRSGSIDMILWCWAQYRPHTQLKHLEVYRTALAMCAVVGGVGRCLTSASIGGHLGLVEQVIADLGAADRLDYAKNWYLEADKVMENGHMHMLQYWQDRLQDWNLGVQVTSIKRTMTAVVEQGHADVFAWWWEHHASASIKKDMGLVRNLVTASTRGSHLPMLELLVNVVRSANLPALLPAIEVIFSAATQAGRVNVLEWWKLRVAEYLRHPVLPKLGWLKSACCFGHLGVVIWWNSIHGEAIQPWIPDLIMQAVREGQSGVLLCLDTIDALAPFDFVQIVKSLPARSIHSEVLAIMVQSWPNELRSHWESALVYGELRKRGLVVLAEQWQRKLTRMV